MEYKVISAWYEAVRDANPDHEELKKFQDLFDLKKSKLELDELGLFDKFTLFLTQASADEDLEIPEEISRPSTFFDNYSASKFWSSKEDTQEESNLSQKSSSPSTDVVSIKIKTIVNNLKDHLASKLEKEHLIAADSSDPGEESFSGSLSSEKLTAKQDKLLKRYDAIFKLSKRLESKSSFEESDMKATKDALQTCLSNKPDWSERPFLQQLTDICSLGFKALYRAYFSEESKLEKKLENTLNHPKPGM
ncbi:MAG: hypothetical protein H0U70_10285 [Tatlockia sp.]|nr:hypothetical protein [Tatlockia sp.]